MFIQFIEIIRNLAEEFDNRAFWKARAIRIPQNSLSSKYPDQFAEARKTEPPTSRANPSGFNHSGRTGSIVNRTAKR
jgi:hypothetical protein